MKNVVRALALALVATGAVASSQMHSAYAATTISPRSNALPIPACPPGDKTGCGVCQYNGNCIN